MTSTSLAYRLYANDVSKSLQRTAAEPQNANAKKYFDANIGKVTSVDGFLNDYKLLSYAMKAYGLQDLGNAKALMKKVLESNLSDPRSFANSLNDNRYRAFAQAFNFTAMGAVASTGAVQTNAQTQDTLSRLSSLGAVAQQSVESQLASVHSVSDLESNSGLYSQVLSAYGIDSKAIPTSEVTAALESNLSDPTSFANNAGNVGLRQLAEDFNFTKGGAAGAQTAIQSSLSIQSTVSAYLGKAGTSATAQQTAQTETAYYLQNLPTLTSVSQLVSDSRLVAYVKTAFGLDPNMSSTDLAKVLTSNLGDPTSAANTLEPSQPSPKSPPGTPLPPSPNQLVAQAFSVGSDGKPFDHSAVQPGTTLAATTSAYTSAIAATAATQSKDDAAQTTSAGVTETAYYATQIGNVTSVDGLLSDTRLVAYLRTAFNLPAPTSSPSTSNTYSLADLRNILTSDVMSPSSAANTSGAGARALATSFNFTSSGLVYSQPAIQTSASLTATTKAYANAAGTSPGAKAATQTETAYYTSTMPYVTSVDKLLSDKRLVAYVETAYGVPTTTSAATLRNVLTSSITDPKSIANKLGGGYVNLAAAFDIGSTGAVQSEPAMQAETKAQLAATTQSYLNVSMETEAGTTYSTGVQLALYFKRVAPTVTSAYGLLADKALTSVTQTILGLSSTSSKSDIDSQAKYISSKINFADFKDPAKLDKLVTRFTALYGLQHDQSSNPVLQLFGGATS